VTSGRSSTSRPCGSGKTTLTLVRFGAVPTAEDGVAGQAEPAAPQGAEDLPARAHDRPDVAAHAVRDVERTEREAELLETAGEGRLVMITGGA
jgi:hypothetical protein